MPALDVTRPHTTKRNWNVEDDPDTLRFALRVMLDFHGPAAVITYATDHGIPCSACFKCGWVPHINEECLLCEIPHFDSI